MTSPCQKEKNKSKIKNIKRKIHLNLIKKYAKLFQKYNSNIIDNIIYNERAHIVALFKDRLIIDDNCEFLKRYYHYDESIIRLPRFYEYYYLFSKIFPNYTSIPEGKYFFQNIQKKQKMIDIQEQFEIEKRKFKINENENSKINISDNYILYKVKNNDYVLSTDVIDSILNETNMEFIQFLFNIDKNNITKEEDIFSEKINNIVNMIKKYEIPHKNKINKKKHKKNQSSSKKKDKKSNNSNSGKKNKINNTLLGNEINNNKIIIPNYFNKSIIRKNTIFNLINNKKINNSINIKKNNLNKINKNDKSFIKIIEHNLFKKKKLLAKNITKNLFHNISNSISIKKELSKTKKNSNNNSRKISDSKSSFNILFKNNSLHYKIKHYNIINPNTKYKKFEIKMKNSLRTPNPLSSKCLEKSCQNFSLDKKKSNKHSNIKIKYNYSSKNIYNNNHNHIKSLKNKENVNKVKKKKSSSNNYKKVNLNIRNINIQHKINHNIANNIKKLNKRKIIKIYKNVNNNIPNKKLKSQNNTHYLIDSRNYILNEILSSYKHRKTNSSKKNSVNSKSSSRYNISKSKSKSNKKNNSKNNLFDSNSSILLKQITKKITNKNLRQIKNNRRNIINRFNWKIDSRNKRVLFISKNTSKYKTKNLLQNDSSLKSSFLGPNNYIKKSNKLQDIKNNSKIFKYINNKNYCSITQRNYSFNNL